MRTAILREALCGKGSYRNHRICPFSANRLLLLGLKSQLGEKFRLDACGLCRCPTDDKAGTERHAFALPMDLEDLFLASPSTRMPGAYCYALDGVIRNNQL